MTQAKPQASAVIWQWRGGESEERVRTHEASAARRRGVLGAAAGLAAAAAVWLLWDEPVAAAVIAAIALTFALLALLAPLTAYRRLTRALDRFAHAVGTGVTWLLMSLIYYLLFLPVGLFLRARRRLGITRTFDSRLASYWISTEGRRRDPESYRRQF